MDGVVHFEVPAANVARARKFYNTVFGWKINPMPEFDYTILQTSQIGKDMMPKERGKINGGMMKRSSQFKNPIITISVASVDAALKKIAKNGGKVVAPKMPVGDMGFTAYFKDSEGNIMGLFQYVR